MSTMVELLRANAMTASLARIVLPLFENVVPTATGCLLAG